ncbi:hypothetical protein PRUPE_8G077300 [Prunus persica]|uniref:Uncharacterized protein n=1 Tax=Prunus persica TaxID=3760 RepID=A0A251MX29_PRUPE|nr:hypothetical protein PRUPE_8G077300 [Prunus persica]
MYLIICGNDGDYTLFTRFRECLAYLNCDLKPLQRTRKNRSHLYSRANKRWIPFQ